MRRCAILFTLGLLLDFFVSAQTIQLQVSFGEPTIQISAQGYSVLGFPDTYQSGSEGEPLLPCRDISLFLPLGMEIDQVKILEIVYSDLMEGISLEPASTQFTTAQGVPPNYVAKPSPEIYSSSQAYPESPIKFISTDFLSGFPIGSFAISALVFYPQQQAVKWVKEVNIEIILKQSQFALNACGNLKYNTSVENRLKALVDNPEAVSTNFEYLSGSEDDVDLLIITAGVLEQAFQDFIDFKLSTGYSAEVLTTEDIYSNYAGVDKQEKIRNAIIDYYQNKGTVYVILGGDSDPTKPSRDVVPHRGLVAWNEEDIPADMYYACLDGNWNTDNDLLWGESSEADLYAEISIGRLSVNTVEEIENFTQKLILYQNAPVQNNIENVLFVGEILEDDPITYGAKYLDEIADGSTNHGMNTAGFSQNFSKLRLYEENTDWGKPDLLDYYNNTGVSFINHVGHANVYTNMKLENNDITNANFTNNGIDRAFSIEYSQGCFCGSFDNRRASGEYFSDDCIIEKLNHLEGGNAASMANSRNGWIAAGNTNSSSQFLHRQFIDAVFGGGLSKVGAAHNQAREENASLFASDQFMRYVVYANTLFGDPSLDIWTETPENIVCSHVSSVTLGTQEIFFNTDTPYARIGLMQDGVQIGRGVANQNGDILIQLYQSITQLLPIEVSVIGHNKNRYLATIEVVNVNAFVAYQNHGIADVGIENGVVDYGETIKLSIEMKNLGNISAQDVDVTISTEDAFVTLTDDTENYGDFYVGQVKTITDGFCFEVAEDIPDQHIVKFEITASGFDEWISEFEIEAFSPELKLLHVSIDDANTGNQNSFFDPGETASLIYYVKNIGHSKVFNFKAVLSNFYGFIEIHNSPQIVDVIDPGEMVQIQFDVDVLDYLTSGTFEEFTFDAVGGEINFLEKKRFKIGHVIESFESGGFDQFDWMSAGAEPWKITSNISQNGSLSVRSGVIDHGEFSELRIRLEVLEEDSISFFVKTSSEEDADILEFRINNNPYGRFSGNSSWVKESYFIKPGRTTFTWVYTKNSHSSVNSDCTWLDFIDLPTSSQTVSINETTGSTEKPGITCFPNPTNQFTTLEYFADRQSEVQIDLYNSNGMKIANLMPLTLMNEGAHKLTVNLNRLVRGKKTGLYFLRLTIGSASQIVKILLVE
jgi:peptidase C25-like protein/type IX secretion system substrate protein